MDKLEMARYLADRIRGIYKKNHQLSEITGFELVEFIDEVEELENFVVNLLEPTPWEGCRMMIHEYMWNQSDMSFDEIVKQIELDWSAFDLNDFLEFVEDYENMYGVYPYGRDLID